MGVSGGVRRPRSPTGRADRADRGDRHQTRSDNRARGRSDRARARIDRARTRSDRARARSDRARARSDRARARSDRARARSDRARDRSDKKRVRISDWREFASTTERGVAAIAPVGSVGAPPLFVPGTRPGVPARSPGYLVCPGWRCPSMPKRGHLVRWSGGESPDIAQGGTQRRERGSRRAPQDYNKGHRLRLITVSIKALRKLNKESRPRAGRLRRCTSARRQDETSISTASTRPSRRVKETVSVDVDI